MSTVMNMVLTGESSSRRERTETGTRLKVVDGEIVNGSATPVTLRGYGLGGWMNMEGFITGHPSNEETLREALLDVLGPEKYAYFFDRFLTEFFTEADARYLRELGCTVLRLPVNYRHFERDDEPMVLREQGFKHLDRVIDLCAREGIYTVIDLHALPGAQNEDWHSDNATHRAFFWRHRHFQDRAVNLWRAIATRYAANPWVAGYDLINEPSAPSIEQLEQVYGAMIAAIREVDPDHIVFLEGTLYGNECGDFTEPFPNAVYSFHDYPSPCMIYGGPYPGYSFGKYFDRSRVAAEILRKAKYMRTHNLPVWVGEFGAVYTDDAKANDKRLRVMRDQLETYESSGIHWAAWPYKDIGFQGLVYADPDSPWMERIRPVYMKMQRMGTDGWSGIETTLMRELFGLKELLNSTFRGYEPYPFGVHWQLKRLVRQILLGEALVPEFAARFEGITFGQIDELMSSFSFHRCLRRPALEEMIVRYAGGVVPS